MGRLPLLTLMVLLLAPAARAQTPPEGPPGTRVALTDGQLFIPQGYRPEPDGADLTLHLHGAAWAAEKGFVAAGQPGVLVSVVLPGLSSVYTARFRDPKVFPRLLEEVRAKLRMQSGRETPLRRLTVSAFSAGFGGVRELLRDPAAFARIDALVMADSIHAGFVGNPAARLVDSAAMEGFARVAREAAAGRKRMVVSHSQLRPEGYASTTETADYLIRHVEGRREPYPEEWAGGLALVSRCRVGGFEVFGFTGDTGAEHMKHLHQLSAFLVRVQPPRRR